jgi:AcrR family transcriptional regulator
MPTRPARLRRKPAADRRIEVVAAARKLFARDGFEAVSQRALAAEAGVSAAALYLYFPDRRALLVAVCDSIFADMIRMFETAAPSRPARDPFAKLRGFMVAYCAWGLAHPAEYRLLFMVKEMHAPDSGHRAASPGGPQLGPELFAMLANEVQALMAKGAMRRADVAMTAEAIWASGHGLIALLTTLGAFPFTEPPKLVAFMADVMLRGLAAR